MMTDGVMDALPVECEEETMKEIIMDIQDETPRETAGGFWNGHSGTAIIMRGMI